MSESFIEEYDIMEIDGWMEEPELVWLYNRGWESPVALEIGCFMGRSSAAILAGQLESSNPGEYRQLYVVDTFDGAGTVREAEVAEHGPGWLAGRFVENMAQRGLTRFTVLEGRSQTPSSNIFKLIREHNQNGKPYLDFVFIDGSHKYHDVLHDINTWQRRIKPGGMIAGHDYHESWPGVQRAVHESFGRERITNPVGAIWAVRI